MNSDWQTVAAPVIVALAVTLLFWSWWRRRGQHEGCDCPGSQAGRELRDLKKRIHR